MCDIYNIFDLLSVKNLWSRDGSRSVSELQSGCPCFCLGQVCLCAVCSSLHSQHLTWLYSPRFQWHVLAECWVQTSAQTWRSQTRGWKSRLESYCFISWGWCDSNSGLWGPCRYIRCHQETGNCWDRYNRGPGVASVQPKVLFRMSCM